jgi:hypothetical protein
MQTPGLDARYALLRRTSLSSRESEIHANGIFNADGMMFSLADWRLVVDEGETS